MIQQGNTKLEQAPQSRNPKGHLHIKNKTKVMVTPAVTVRTTEEEDIGVEEEVEEEEM